MIRSTRARSFTGRMASAAFLIKFMMTCCNSIRSQNTCGSEFGQLGPDHDAMAVQFCMLHREDFTDEIVDVEKLFLQGIALKQCPQACNHVAGATPIAFDMLHRCSRFGQVWRSLRKP